MCPLLRRQFLRRIELAEDLVVECHRFRLGLDLVVLPVKDSRLWKPGFDFPGMSRIRLAHHQAKERECAWRKPEILGHLLRLATQTANIDRAKIERLGRSHDVLRGQCGINHTNQKRF